MTNKRSVFISHSTMDKDYGMALKNLLDLLMPKQNIFLSSSEFDGVRVNEDINKTIKSEIRNDAYVIFLLSDHFYSSVACLNEMGAAWVSGNKYALVILPGFSIESDKFKRSLINIHQKAVHIWEQVDIWQLIESLFREFDIGKGEHDPHECCLKFISQINKKNKEEIENIPVYERLRKAEKKIAAGLNLSEAYSERGKARSELKQYELAVKDYLYSIFLKPDEVNTYNRMIQAVGMANGGYRKEVMAVAEEMCRRFPDDPRSYGCRGYVRSNNDDLEGAIADCNKALEMKENRWHYNTRGRCWAVKGKLEQGEKREIFWFRALQDYWHSQHVSPGYAFAVENIRNIVTLITPERINKEIEKLKKSGDETTARMYQECLEIVGV